MTRPLKAMFCTICGQRHYVDAGCDPTDKRYVANARAMAYAEIIEHAAANPLPVLPQRTTEVWL